MKRVENTTRSGVCLTKMRGDWIGDKTLFGVFDISSQWKQKLRSKRRSKIVKIYVNYLLKTGYPNLLHGRGFLIIINESEKDSR